MNFVKLLGDTGAGSAATHDLNLGSVLFIGNAGGVDSGVIFNGGSDNDNVGSDSLLAIITAEANVRINGPTRMDSDLSITTGLAGAGDILFTANATVDSQATERNDLTLETGTGDIRFSAAVGGIVRLHDVLITQARNVDIDATSSLKALTLTQNNGTGTTTLNGPVDMDSTAPLENGIRLRNNIINVNSAVTTAGTRITFTADTMQINPASGSLNNTALGLVRLWNKTAGRTIDLGTETAGSLSLTDAELDKIKTGTLRIGRLAADTDGIAGNTNVASGTISVTNAISLDPIVGTTTLHLRTGGEVESDSDPTPGTPGTIAVNGLGIESVQRVSLRNGNDINLLAAEVFTAGQTFEFRDIDDLQISHFTPFIGTLDNLIGLSTNNGDIKLTVGTTFNINDDLSAGARDVTLSVGTLGTQSLGNDIFARGLQLLGTGAYELQNVTNNVSTIAGTTGGQIRYTDADGLSIGVVSSSLNAPSTGITAPGQLVSLTSVAGGITDGNGGATNITSGSAALRARDGIGSGVGGELETKVSTLSASNTTAGDIRIHNTVGGPLALDTVDGFNGVSNTAPLGAIEITNDGTMNINRPVSNLAGGDIDLTTTAGNLSVNLNGPVKALGGNGDIRFTTAGNLVLNDTGELFDVQVEGTGFVQGIAAGTVLTPDVPNTIVKSATGTASRVPILIQNVTTPQVNALGEAQLILDVGVSTETNFTIIIDWADGTIETFTLPVGGVTYTFNHTYDGNPDAGNPAAPIPINFVIDFDDNIRFFGGSGAVDLNTNEQTPIAPVPGEGLGGKRIDTSPKVTFLGFPATIAINYIASSSSTQTTSSTSTQTQTGRASKVEGEARKVILRVFNPDGSFDDYQFETETNEQVEEILAMFPDYFREKNVPDGHYQVLLKEGDEEPLVVFDYNIHLGMPTDASQESEGSQDKPPTPQSEETEETETDGTDDGEAEVDEQAAQENGPDGAVEAGLPVAAPADDVSLQPLAIDRLIAAQAAQENAGQHAGHSPAAAILLPAAALAGALLAGESNDRWEDRVDRALSSEGSNALTKAGRLARRVRRAMQGKPR